MKRWVIAGVLFALVIAGTSWWALRRNASPSFTLPDGSRMHFHGATIGLNPKMDFGSRVEKFLRHVPRELGSKQIRNMFVHRWERETLTFWFEFERMPAPNSVATVEFLDDNQRREFQARAWLAPRTLPNGRIIATCSFHEWPQWDKTLAVRIAQLNTNTASDAESHFVALGDLTVPNPDFESR